MKQFTIAIGLAQTVVAEVAKTQFTGSILKPPVYMVGEFYTETKDSFNQQLYVVPSVYIDSSS